MTSNAENGLLLRHRDGPIVAIVMAIGSLVAWGYWWPPSFFDAQQATLSFPAHGLSTGRGEIAEAAAIVLIGACLLFFVPKTVRVIAMVLAALALTALLVDVGFALSASIGKYQDFENQFNASGANLANCQTISCDAAGFGTTGVLKHSVLPVAGAAFAGFFALLALLFMLSDTLHFSARRRAQGSSQESPDDSAAGPTLAAYPPPVPQPRIEQSASPGVSPTSVPEANAIAGVRSPRPRCSQCGADVIPGSAFCDSCGSNLSPSAVATQHPSSPLITQEHLGAARGSEDAPTLNCATCGELISPDLAFCGACGTRVTPVAL